MEATRDPWVKTTSCVRWKNLPGIVVVITTPNKPSEELVSLDIIYLFTNTVYMKIIYNNNSTLDRPESGLLGILNIFLKSIDCMVNMKMNA